MASLRSHKATSQKKRRKGRRWFDGRAVFSVEVGLFPMQRSGRFRKSPAILFSVVREMTAKYLNQVAARQRAEIYCKLHPRSPSAVRSPKLSVRSGVWIALLGKTVRDGIAGFGPTVEAALRAFDVQYLNALRQPGKTSALDRAA